MALVDELVQEEDLDPEVMGRPAALSRTSRSLKK